MTILYVIHYMLYRLPFNIGVLNSLILSKPNKCNIRENYKLIYTHISKHI